MCLAYPMGTGCCIHIESMESTWTTWMRFHPSVVDVDPIGRLSTSKYPCPVSVDNRSIKVHILFPLTSTWIQECVINMLKWTWYRYGSRSSATTLFFRPLLSHVGTPWQAKLSRNAELAAMRHLDSTLHPHHILHSTKNTRDNTRD